MAVSSNDLTIFGVGDFLKELIGESLRELSVFHEEKLTQGGEVTRDVQILFEVIHHRRIHQRYLSAERLADAPPVDMG